MSRDHCNLPNAFQLGILLTRHSCNAPYMTPDFFTCFPPRNTRTHEVCGPGALAFAFSLAGQLGGTVLWVCEGWRSEHINPSGFAPYMDPKNLLLAKPNDQTDALAVAEEALRSGTISLVVIEVNTPLSLKAGRRLQLAAEAGKSMGLCIIQDGMGSNASETRWQCSAIFDAEDSTLQNWRLIKNKAGTLSAWDVGWNVETRRIIVVPKTGK